MKNNQNIKIFLVGFLSALFLAGIFTVRGCVKYNKAREAWEIEKESLLIKAADSELEAEKSYNIAMRWRKKANEHREQVAELTKEVVSKEAELKNVAGSVSELAPDDMVVKARTFLDVSNKDIVLTRRGVVFSYEGMTKAVESFVKFEFTLTDILPTYKALVEEQRNENDALVISNDLLQTSVDGYKANAAYWKKMYEGEYKLRLDAEQRISLFPKETIYIATGVIIIVVGSILIFVR